MILWWPEPDRCWGVLFSGEEGAASPFEACRQRRSPRAVAVVWSLPHLRVDRCSPLRDLVTTLSKAQAFCAVGEGAVSMRIARTDRSLGRFETPAAEALAERPRVALPQWHSAHN